MSAYPSTLRTAAFPRVNLRTDAALIALGAGLISLCAQISIPLPFTPVPITGQTFAVLLVGSSLGMVRGLASCTLYLLLGIVGAPVYADRAHGWDVVVGSSGGYLVGFLFAGALVGFLAERGWDKRFSTATSAMLAGNVVIYLCGTVWLAHVLNTGLAKTLEYGLYPFVPGDIFKLYLAALALPAAWKIVGRR